MDFLDDKLALFMNRDILQETVDTSVDKGIDLAQVRWFTQPENRIALAKQMLTGNYHIAPPHIIQIPKRDSSEMRKVYCNEPLDRIVCALRSGPWREFRQHSAGNTHVRRGASPHGGKSWLCSGNRLNDQKIE